QIPFDCSFSSGRRDIRMSAGAFDSRDDGPHTKFAPQIPHPRFSGPRALENGQKITYVTERAVLELREAGLTVTEIAPGVDLENDVLARSNAPLAVADDLSVMEEGLFREPPFGLHLPARAPHTRLLGHTPAHV